MNICQNMFHPLWFMKMQTFVKIVQWNVYSTTFWVNFFSQRHLFRPKFKKKIYVKICYTITAFFSSWLNSDLLETLLVQNRKAVTLVSRKNQFITQKYWHSESNKEMAMFSAFWKWAFSNHTNQKKNNYHKMCSFSLHLSQCFITSR